MEKEKKQETKQAKRFNIVIMKNDKKENPLNEQLLINWLRAYCKLFALILHDKDINELGEIKKPHYHIYIYLHKRNRYTYPINQLSKLLNIEKNRIQIEYTDSELLSIQYLVHKNNKNKYQYSIKQINTNNIEYIENMINGNDNIILTTKQLIKIVENNFTNKLNIIKEIGIGNYTKYIHAINALIEYFRLR